MSPAPKKKRPARRQTVSGQLRAIIKARGKSPYSVSQDAKVSPSVLTRFVNGERGLSTESFDAVCEALGLELRETRRGIPTGKAKADGDAG